MGHAWMHFVQSLQRSWVAGWSGVSGASVSMLCSRIHGPYLGLIIRLFFPIGPSPASCAIFFWLSCVGYMVHL